MDHTDGALLSKVSLNRESRLEGLLTTIVILIVATVLLERYRTVGTVPALVAATFPHQLATHMTLAVLGAAVNPTRT